MSLDEAQAEIQFYFDIAWQSPQSHPMLRIPEPQFIVHQ
jgi:hypothetical protein